nr:tetrahydromethanopterin S-methyltransferase subunit B [Methanosalsum natronophilum]
MSMVHIAPEAHLVLDPETSLLAEERPDVISYSMDPMMVQVDKLDLIADDLISSLTPDQNLASSYPNRGRASYHAGLVSSAAYGILAGFVFTGILALILYIMALFGGVI